MENTTSLHSMKDDKTKLDPEQETSSQDTYDKFRKQHYRTHANDTEHYDHFYKSITYSIISYKNAYSYSNW